MLGEISLIMVLFAVSLIIINLTANKIPKTGRDGTANGDRIIATITNENKYADRAAFMHAEKDGKKFKVKMKPTEANLWIKGDSIEIIQNSDGKNYRVLFNDYFRKNEARLREKAVNMLEKASKCKIAALFTGYKKEMAETISSSALSSKQIFSFVTYMKLIDIYSVVAVLLVALLIVWKVVVSPELGEFLLPIVLIALVIWSVYAPVGFCKRLMKEAQKS